MRQLGYEKVIMMMYDTLNKKESLSPQWYEKRGEGSRESHYKRLPTNKCKRNDKIF